MDRVDCHNHTRYSNIRLRDALPTPDQLIDRAIELGLKGIAITDHECLSAHPKAIKHFDEIKEANPEFKLILGDEIYLVNERPNDDHYHYILLAKDFEGHRQLRILSSLAWINSYTRKGLERVDTLKSDLERIVKANPGHLIASTACIGGELGKRILAMTAAEKIGDKKTIEDNHNAIVNFILWNKELFGDDFYLEVQPGISKEQIIVNQRMISISACFGVKMICTSDSHYLKKEDRYVHKAFLNSKEGEREVDAFYADAYLHSNKEMIEKFAKSNYDSKFVEQMFANTMEIYNKAENYTLFHSQQIPKVEVKNYPKRTCNSIYPILESMFESDDIYERYWVNECYEKLKELDKLNETYLSRLEYEADIKRTIGEALHTNMFSYPTTLAHYVDIFWKLGSTVGAGRGSSCSGLNHYLLGITQLDPIEWNLPFWRYLNKERFELGDIDLDLAPSKRPAIINYIKHERGQNFNDDIDEIFKEQLGCTLVATFGTETSKSAILTACRGYRSEEYPDGIDNDTAQYLSSLVPVERGFVWSIHDVYYGNSDKDRQPVPAFKQDVDTYPGLLEIMLGVEGNISHRGSHASGVIFNDEDPFEFNAYMKTPSGDIITQYDLHDAEWCGATKYDFLVTEVQDKITCAIKFLQEYGEIDKNLSLKEVYDKYFHPSIIPIEDEKTWKAIQQVKVLDLFQFDSAVGSQAAKKICPKTILELADANGLMRLMTSEKGAETPMDKYVRFKNNIHLWYDEMDRYGLTKEEQETLKPHFLRSHGVPPSQEQLMTMLMDEKICGFSLKDANAARKIVGKKQMSKIPALHKQITDQAKSEALGRYVWDCGVGPQMGYSFSIIHALAYSFIGFQTAYIATHWDSIYWNAACLVVNSGSLEDADGSTDYAKIAKAVASINSQGIDVSLVNINTSDYGFKPDVAHNRILYGLKALSNISADTIEKINAGRPYTGIKDFMTRCPLTKTAVINLIKAGAFDEVDADFNGDRRMIMAYYINNVCEAKKKLTLQNFNGLIQHNLIPKELELQVRVYNFTKYIKANKKVGKYYAFDDVCTQFYEKFLPDEEDKLEVINGIVCILQDEWEKIYKKYMDSAREWIKENQDEILSAYNEQLFLETWNKYAEGTCSKWEMDSLCFYHGPHELARVDHNKYGIVNFNDMENEEIDYFFKRAGRQIPIYKLRRIIGTCLAKNDTRHSITLLTTTGVVNVKFSGEYYAQFKKQISQINPDGTKSVVEKGWFRRGVKLMIQGFRKEDTFVAKSYTSSDFHQLYIIDKVDNDSIVIRHDRYSGNNTYEEDDYE